MGRYITLCLCLAASLSCRRPVAAPMASLPRPLVLAHRGGGGEGPEATLPTMLATVQRYPGVVIEMDVRRSQDGHLVVIHDATVDRTTNGSGAVADLPLSQILALDAGHCASPGRGNGTTPAQLCRTATDPALFPFRGRGYRIPTLAQVLSSLPRSTIISVEVKSGGYEAEVARALRGAGRAAPFIVGAVDDDVADRLRRLLPEALHYFPRNAATRLVLGAKFTFGALAYPTYQVLAVPPKAGPLRTDTQRVVSVARKLGVAVLYWTINDPTEMGRLLDLGADGLITDYPGRAMELLARRRAAKP